MTESVGDFAPDIKQFLILLKLSSTADDITDECISTLQRYAKGCRSLAGFRDSINGELDELAIHLLELEGLIEDCKEESNDLYSALDKLEEFMRHNKLIQ